MAFLFGTEVLCRERAAAARKEVSNDIWYQNCGLLELVLITVLPAIRITLYSLQKKKKMLLPLFFLLILYKVFQ